jgi:hypothetical protein
MKKSKFSEKQISYALRLPAADECTMAMLPAVRTLPPHLTSEGSNASASAM